MLLTPIPTFLNFSALHSILRHYSAEAYSSAETYSAETTLQSPSLQRHYSAVYTLCRGTTLQRHTLQSTLQSTLCIQLPY